MLFHNIILALVIFHYHKVAFQKMYPFSLRSSHIQQSSCHRSYSKKIHSKNFNRAQFQLMSKSTNLQKRSLSKQKIIEDKFCQSFRESKVYRVCINEPINNVENQLSGQLIHTPVQQATESLKVNNSYLQKQNKKLQINKFNIDLTKSMQTKNISNKLLKNPKHIIDKKRYSFQVQQSSQSFLKKLANSVQISSKIDKKQIRKKNFEDIVFKSRAQCMSPKLKKYYTSYSNQKMSSYCAFKDKSFDQNKRFILKLNQTYEKPCSVNFLRNKKESLQRLKNKVESYIALMTDIENKANNSLSTSTSIQFKGNQYSQENSPIKKFLTPREQNHSNLFSSFVYNSVQLKEKQYIKPVSIKDFRILKKVGSGQYGQIYLSIHKITKFLYALKKISKEYIKKNNLQQRVILQIKIQSFINHPNLVKLYGCFSDTQNIYLILEYMQQGSLYDLMTSRNYHKSNVKLLTEQKTTVILSQILKAVSQLHQHHIIHRDIKPQNIVMSHGISKICDLGWSVYNGQNQRRNTSCGTFDYLPPQILKNQSYDQSIDLWQVGILSYELMTGYLPFYHPSRKQTFTKIINFQGELRFPKDLPQINCSFIRSLIQKKSQKRIPANKILLHPFFSSYQ